MQQDFGDLTVKRDLGNASSSTRGLFAGGNSAPCNNLINTRLIL